MVHELLGGFLRIGMFVTLCSVGMLFIQEPGSEGFILSACAAMPGILLVIGVVVLYRRVDDLPDGESAT